GHHRGAVAESPAVGPAFEPAVGCEGVGGDVVPLLERLHERAGAGAEQAGRAGASECERGESCDGERGDTMSCMRAQTMMFRDHRSSVRRSRAWRGPTTYVCLTARTTSSPM